MWRIVRIGLASALLAVGCRTRVAGPMPPAPGQTGRGVNIVQLADRLRVEVNGRLFTEYFYTNVPRPYFFPLMGPGGLPLTRNWPMKETTNEEKDHPHHRSLWFAHGAVNGRDFWSEQKDFGRIVHDGFLEIKTGGSGLIRSRNRWIAADGSVVCTDERALRIYAPANAGEQIFDFDITLRASNGGVTFGDTKEGAMAVRLGETMRLKTSAGKGHIVTSTGARDGAAWGKRADWCDYFGPVDGKIVGIAIFDHPENPRHPTWWHVRDYGLFAANPFGQHDFEKLDDRAAGDLKIPAGESVTFRYRFYLHEGDEQQARVAVKYQEYAKEKTVR